MSDNLKNLMDMYEARQNKENISRRIDAGAEKKQNRIIQRKYFNNYHRYQSVNSTYEISNFYNMTLPNVPIAHSMTIQKVTWPSIRRLLKGGGSASLLGGLLGSVIPGVGTLLGSGIGMVVGITADLFKEYLESKKRNIIKQEKNIEISDEISGFILAEIEKTLNILPVAHLKGNDSLSIFKSGDGSMGNASFYDFDKTIEINNPLGMPDILYVLLNKKSRLQRNLMDRGTIGRGEITYAGNGAAQYNPNIDNATNQQSNNRHIMAGVSDTNSQERLLPWTLRHEIGHSVDKQIHWKDDYSKERMFGGWVNVNKNEFLKHIICIAMSLDDIFDYKFCTNNALLNEEQGASVLRYKIEGKDNYANIMLMVDGKAVDSNMFAIISQKYGMAINHPWMFDDGCRNGLTHNGRVYMYDEYETPCSYIADARKYAVSNYQFAAAEEWFAEAYAAFYNPDPNAASRERLSDDVKHWFTENLGGCYNSDKWNSPAAFITKNGKLTAAYKKCAYYLHEYTAHYASVQDSDIWYAAIDIMDLPKSEWTKLIIAYKIYELTKSKNADANYYAACNLISNNEIQVYKNEIDNSNGNQQ